MIDLTRLFYLAFGLITLGGGLQAFVTVRSKPSLVAGGVSGALLLLAAWLTVEPHLRIGLILGLVLCVALAGRFLPKFFREKQWWPAGIEGLLGASGLILSVVALLSA